MIFIDRSVPKSVADALKLVRDDVMWLEDPWIFRHNTPDKVWLSVAGPANWLVVARDKKIRTRPAERQAIVDAGVGAFVFTQKQDPTRWDYLRLLASNLDEMERIFSETVRPFIYGIQRSGQLKRVL